MNTLIEIRKTVIHLEDVWHDGGPRVALPLRKGAIAAVVRNPYAGRYVEDLSEWMKVLDGLGDSLAGTLLSALALRPDKIESFGKGTIVGVNGQIEHGAAWHAPGGSAIKRLLGVKGFVSAGQIMGSIGERLHIPLVSVHSPWVRSHFDGVDISVSDAPKPDEVLFALAMANGGRIHARLGGLTFAEGAKGEGPKF